MWTMFVSHSIADSVTLSPISKPNLSQSFYTCFFLSGVNLRQKCARSLGLGAYSSVFFFWLGWQLEINLTLNFSPKTTLAYETIDDSDRRWCPPSTLPHFTTPNCCEKNEIIKSERMCNVPKKRIITQRVWARMCVFNIMRWDGKDLCEWLKKIIIPGLDFKNATIIFWVAIVRSAWRM